MEPRAVTLLHTELISLSSRITSLWSRSLATEHSTKLTILGYFASNNERCLGILKSRISPGRETPLLMQHLAIHHRVSMQSSQVSPYAPEWIMWRGQLSQPFVVMLHHSPRYHGSESSWRQHHILACAFSWWPLKKASQAHVAKRTTLLWHSGCTAWACVSQAEPSYTRIGW